MICQEELYDGNPIDPDGYQEVIIRISTFLNFLAYVIHARHATFWLFYAKFPH